MELSESGLGGSGGAPAVGDVEVAVGFAALVVVVNAADMSVQTHFTIARPWSAEMAYMKSWTRQLHVPRALAVMRLP